MSVASTRFIQATKSSPEEFRALYGVTKEVYKQMVKAHQELFHRKRDGRGFSLSAPEQVLCALQYWSTSISHDGLAKDWGLHRSTVIRLIERVRRSLTEARLSLPNKQQEESE